MLSLRIFLPAAILIFCPAITTAENWPAWRGPNADGVTAESDLPLKWSATENVKWKVPLPEPGNSTPIVWGDRIFLTQAVDKRRTLMCLDRTGGRVLWQKGPEWTEPEQTHKSNPYCASSPVTDGERVIAWFGSAGIWCWDLEGKALWHVDLGKQDHIWGYGSSPVLIGDLCLLNFGPGPRSFLVALDKRTGAEKWRFDVPPPAIVEGPGAGQDSFVGSWNTPVVMNNGDRTEIVATLPGGVFGLDPATGRELWHCNGLNPLAYADPVLAGDVIVAFGGFGGFSMGVKTGGSGDVTDTHRLWQERRNPQLIGSGVAVDGRIYIGSDAGIMQCLEASTGKSIWKERPPVPGNRAASWSSIVRSGDRLYLLTKNSDTVVFRAAPEFELLAVNSLEDGMTNASLAVADGDLFIRTHRHLWCITASK